MSERVDDDAREEEWLNREEEKELHCSLRSKKNGRSTQAFLSLTVSDRGKERRQEFYFSTLEHSPLQAGCHASIYIYASRSPLTWASLIPLPLLTKTTGASVRMRIQLLLSKNLIPKQEGKRNSQTERNSEWTRRVDLTIILSSFPFLLSFIWSSLNPTIPRTSRVSRIRVTVQRIWMKGSERSEGVCVRSTWFFVLLLLLPCTFKFLLASDVEGRILIIVVLLKKAGGHDH